MEGRKLRVLLAFDSFKDTLTAEEAAGAVTAELRRCIAEELVEERVRHLSDGGEGFLRVFSQTRDDLEVKSLSVTGPLCSVAADGSTASAQEVQAQYGLLRSSGGHGAGKGREVVAVTEMAQAAGLELVPAHARAPMLTTTRGVGELLKHLAEVEHCTRIILGVGGSATSDGGLGMLPPLGVPVRLSGCSDCCCGGEAVLAGRDLCRLEALEGPLGRSLPGVELQVACDVQNPFTGPNGAVHVFARQKGASESDIEELEVAMERLEEEFVRKGAVGAQFRGMEGCGAAGGVAGCLLSIAESATLKRGILIIDEALQLSEAVEWADVIFTGEGSYDAQTESGKVVSHVEALCEKASKRLVVLCGRTDRVMPPDAMRQCFDLVSRFGVERSMNAAGECLQQLLPEVFAAVPELAAAMDVAAAKK